MPTITRSGTAMAVTDMDADGMDDIVVLDSAKNLHVFYQNVANQPFTGLDLGPVGKDRQWSICTGDINNDAINDILVCGFSEAKVFRSTAKKDYLPESLDGVDFLCQGSNMSDIDNDGLLDLLVLNDDGPNLLWQNIKTGFLSVNWIDFHTPLDSDNSGNYAAIWVDINNDYLQDLYVVKCREGVDDPTDPRRINMLFFQSRGDSTSFRLADESTGLNLGGQSWSIDFGDYDNDGDEDCFVTHHDVPSQLLQNDGHGVFLDVTEESGIRVDGVPLQGFFCDFDNDGYLDLFVAGSIHSYFHNNRDGTFQIVGNEIGEREITSAACGDLNTDGYIDLLASYSRLVNEPSSIPDQVFLSRGGSNHFVNVALRGSDSNFSGIGARVVVHSQLGTQTREVRSGVSYGINNSLQQHFGLGSDLVVDSLIIYWPSGKIDKYFNLTSDQHFLAQEGKCLSPLYTLNKSSSEILCPGDSVVLTGIENQLSYHWSDGTSRDSVVIKTDASIQLMSLDDQGCQSNSYYVSVDIDPELVLRINPLDNPDTILCWGEEVVLTTNLDSPSLIWSTGETSETIAIDSSGTYWVMAQAPCRTFTSDPLTFNFVDLSPGIKNDTITKGSVASLEAEGDSVCWFADHQANELIATGSIFETGPLEESRSFYVKIKSAIGIRGFSAGLDKSAVDTSRRNDNRNFAGRQIFDVYKPIVLQSVWIGSDTSGTREILLRNNLDVIRERKEISLDTGWNQVTLDWVIPEGSGYQIGTNEGQNLVNFGSTSPGFWSTSSLDSYPLNLHDILSIRKSNLGESFYFYFYDWEVQLMPDTCEVGPLEVRAIVDPSTAVFKNERNAVIGLFPNPCESFINLSVNRFFENTHANISILDVYGMERYADSMTLSDLTVLELGDLPAGLYFLIMQIGKRSMTLKFLRR